MAVALKLLSVERLLGRGKKATFEPTFSGSYANPETLDFTAATNPSALPFPGGAPDELQITNGIAGYGFEAVVGTTAANSSLKIYDPNGTVTLGGGLVTHSFGAGDIKGSTTVAAGAAAETADQAAGPTNPALIIAEATFTAIGTTAYSTIANQPDVGRSLVFVIHNDSGGPLNMYEGAMEIDIVGTFRGAAQAETFTWEADGGNKAIANTKFRYKASNKPFDTITSITVTNPADGGLKMSVAPGSKLGLPFATATGAEADIIKLYKNAANLVITGTLNNTYQTVNFGTLADGDDCAIEYLAAGEGVPSMTASTALLPASPYPAIITTEDANMRIAAIFKY